MAWKKVKVTQEELRVIGLTCEFYRWENAPDTPETQAEEEERKAQRLKRRAEIDKAYNLKPLPLPEDMK